jgi:phosphatidylglycerol:prolipoprotein diacylglycerol transferase
MTAVMNPKSPVKIQNHMHPILLELGPLSIKTYGFLIAVGFLIGIALASREAKRVGINQQTVLDLAFYIILGAIIGSRLFYVITHPEYFRESLLDAFKVWEGGLTFYGGFIMALAVAVFMIKKHRLPACQTLDLFAPSLAVGILFGRLGCFFAGCCYGRHCSLPWAVTFTSPQSLAELNVPLHPVQLYAAAGSAVTLVVLLYLKNRKTFHGELALVWIMLYSGFRLFEELFRGGVRGDLVFNAYPASQVMALVLLIAAAALFPVLKKRNRCL